MPSASLQNADSLKGSDIIGRFFYKIDRERIVKGGCNGQRNAIGEKKETCAKILTVLHIGSYQICKRK